MPVYTYRREDGTTFEIRQSFTDNALTTDPETGQKVVRLVQSAGIVFKGSGFYVNDSKSASKSTLTTAGKDNKDSKETKDSGKEATTATSTSTETSSGSETKTPVKELSPIPQPPAAAS